MLLAILSVITGLVFWLGLSEVIHELILSSREVDEEHKQTKLHSCIDARDNNI